MYLHGLIAQLIKVSVATRVLKGVAGGLLGLAVLAWIVEHSGPQHIEVVVHVVEPDVEVSVGDRTYRIDGRRRDPILCELSPGWHQLVMRRGDRILFEETFEVRPGANVCATAYDRERLDRSRVPSVGDRKLRSRCRVDDASGGRARTERAWPIQPGPSARYKPTIRPDRPGRLCLLVEPAHRYTRSMIGDGPGTALSATTQG